MGLNDEINNAIGQNSAINQFSTATTPFHAHNGIDSPQVSYQNLLQRDNIETVLIPGTSAATTSNYNVFFIALFPCIFVGATEVHSTAGSSTPTLQIEKLTGTTASGSGTSLLLSAFTLNSIANTVQTAKLANLSKSNFNLAKGDRLGLVTSGTYTAVANVVVMVNLQY